MNVIRSIATELLHLAIVLPLLILFMKKDKRSYTLLVFFLVYYVFNIELLRLPFHFEFMDLIGGKRNWDGKLYALTGSVIIYFLFRKELFTTDYITTRQKPGSLKPVVILALVVLALGVSLRLLFDSSAPFDIEILAFQLTLPGLDEEIAFRGIQLGILTTILAGQWKIGSVNLGNPAMYITAILFGFMHALQLDENWSITMNWFYFLYTGLIGIAYAWMTLRSGSILISTISHNLSNFLGNLVVMLK